MVGDPPLLAQAARIPRADWSVALISMPFGSMSRPSIQIGTLAVIARSHGFPTDTLHLNLDFAACLGAKDYHPLTQQREAVGDWLFSAEAFGSGAPDIIGDPAFLDRFACQAAAPSKPDDSSPSKSGSNVGSLLEVRRRVVPAFLDAVMAEVDWRRFRVVGFTSTFQQNVASLALARRLKERFPELVVIFGGSNFEGDMGREWIRTMEVIDYAVTGEGDIAFPALLTALADGTDPLAVPGVLGRRNGAVAGTPPDPPFVRMDELPIPDYDEFFERAERLGLLSVGVRREVQLPFEGARGCWWGAKHHCTFCGLNGQSMAFRAKSPERVIAELGELARRYRSFDFNAVDNIAATNVLSEVLPALARSGATYRLFYEVKANLTRKQVRGLRAGGVRHIQPGIESLSSPVLALMRKGTRAVTNVNLLRWCLHYGIHVHWNLLWGFPGESQTHYDEQAALMSRLTHLQPPDAASRIWMERFSPLFVDRVSFPARLMRPEASLRSVYPTEVDLEKAAYFFDFELDKTLPDDAYEAVAAAAEGWRQAWREPVRPSLRWWHAPGLLQVEDLRRPAEPGTHSFRDPLASLYLACSDKPVTASKVRTDLNLPYSVDEVTEALDQFCQHGLMMRDGDLFLALALPATNYPPEDGDDSLNAKLASTLSIESSHSE